MEKIIIIGAGGHAKSCVDVILSQNKFEIYGLVEKDTNKDSFDKDIPIIGTDTDLDRIRKEVVNVHVGIAHMGEYDQRKEIINKLTKLKYNFPILTSSHTYISNLSQIMMGTIVMHGSIINAYVKIGEHNIINTNVIIEHDVEIGNNCHIAPGVTINGNVFVGDNVFIGSGSIIHQNINIPSNTIIASASKIDRKYFNEKK